VSETANPDSPLPLLARPTEALNGEGRVPGDKSLSHRALMFSALAVGEAPIEGLLEGEDVLGTAAALRALGVAIERLGPQRWQVSGVGLGGLDEPQDVLDFGNAGTGARLFMGLLATQPIYAVLTGDASLRRRPMARVVEPLRRMGARIETRAGGRLPASLQGPRRSLPIRYLSPVASAQVKSAILLCGLAAPGETQVIEPQASRDHSERMLRYLGAEVTATEEDDGHHVAIMGECELRARPIVVPADPSSAAFPAVAAAILPGSQVRLPGIGVNPLRTGLLTTLKEMGADIRLENERNEAGEPVADLSIRGGRLQGIEVPAERAPSMIDEYPILAVAAGCAEGRSHFPGLAELRVKESDRLATVAAGLRANGIEIEEGPD